MSDPQDSSSSTRRELIGTSLVAVGSALLIALLWLMTRGAPSATLDPAMTPPVLVPTRIPEPPATPAPPAIT